MYFVRKEKKIPKTSKSQLNKIKIKDGLKG